MKKKFAPAFALALALLCAFSLGANASSTLQAITAYLNPVITITLDGEVQELKDANGTRIYPISYNGSTYLPIRAISGMLGVEVDWDQATKTVLLGSKQKGVDLINTYKAYFKSDGAGQVQTSDKKTEDISGITCDHWLWLSTDGLTTKIREKVVSFNLQGKHDTLTFSCYANKNMTLTVLGDNGAVLGEYSITGGAVAKTITVPLLQTNELTFKMAASSSTNGRIFNVYLDAE